MCCWKVFIPYLFIPFSDSLSASVSLFRPCSWRLACRCPARWSWWGRSWWRTKRSTTRQTEAPRKSCQSRFPTPTVILQACASPPPLAQVWQPRYRTSHKQSRRVTQGPLSYYVLDVERSRTVWIHPHNGSRPLCSEALERNSANVYHSSFSWPSPSAESIIGCCIYTACH